jgi:hypothetical protein
MQFAPAPPPRRSRPSVDVSKTGGSHSARRAAPAAADPRGSASRPSSASSTAADSGSSTPPPPHLKPRPPLGGRSERDDRPLANDPVFAAWMARHPDATHTEVNAEMRRRQLEKLGLERVRTLGLMKRYYDEIAELEGATATPVSPDLAPLVRPDGGSPSRSAEDIGSSSAGSAQLDPLLLPAPPSMLRDAPAPQGSARRCVLPVADPYDVDRQRLAWELLMGTAHASAPAEPAMIEANSTLQAASSSIDIAGGQLTQPVREEPFSGYDDVGTWVQRHWRHATHRHEAAATKIQCAFRRYYARCRAERQRIKRKATIAAVLASEAAFEDTWVVAVATREESAREAAAVERRVLILKGFLKRVRAWMQRRRLTKAKTLELRSETEVFAATRIQALVRGHIARQAAYLLRHPEIAINRERALRDAAASVIQAAMRSKLTRNRVKRHHAAALKAQTAFRRFSAANRVAQLRRAMRHRESSELRFYSAAVLQRFFGRLVRRKYERFTDCAAQVALLGRTGRGFLARRVDLSELRYSRASGAATRIQCLARQFLARRHMSQQRQRVSARNERDRRDHAAGVIARTFRRVMRQRILHEQQHQDDAAREIQRVIRGHIGRQRTKARRALRDSVAEDWMRYDAAVVIQAATRGHLLRRHQRARGATGPAPTDGRPGAALTIQAFYRSQVRRPRTSAAIHAAARVIVCFLRCVPSIKRVRAMQRALAGEIDQQMAAHAALVIQVWTRAQVARMTTKRLRDVRQDDFQRVRESEAAAVLARFMRRATAHRRYLRNHLAKSEL